MSLSPEDKQKLRDAFQKALDRDPIGADTPFYLEGNTNPVTHRILIANTLKNEEAFFDGIDKAVKSGNGTVDDCAKRIQNWKFPQPPEF